MSIYGIDFRPGSEIAPFCSPKILPLQFGRSVDSLRGSGIYRPIRWNRPDAYPIGLVHSWMMQLQGLYSAFLSPICCNKIPLQTRRLSHASAWRISGVIRVLADIPNTKAILHHGLLRKAVQGVSKMQATRYQSKLPVPSLGILAHSS
jgi:hypothetical protein